jgi:hypothetical protein
MPCPSHELTIFPEPGIRRSPKEMASERFCGFPAILRLRRQSLVGCPTKTGRPSDSRDHASKRVRAGAQGPKRMALTPISSFRATHERKRFRRAGVLPLWGQLVVDGTDG